MKIKILDSAEEDLVEGYRFYESSAEGLGDYFLDSLYSDIQSLNDYAGIHPHYFGYYRLLAKKFPYAVYYKIEENKIRVYAVLDCRRNPAWIKIKLS
jgi:plasmid stabilization system protein ParE